MPHCIECSIEIPPYGGQRWCFACRLVRETHRGRAGNRVGIAIKKGELVRQPCEVCGAAKTDAHHDDYSKPLDVRWLCRLHHFQHHAKQRRLGLFAPQPAKTGA